jgi:MoxR-like ATPase
VRTLGRVLGCESKRIQFTPDLMPSDVTGGNVFNQQRGAFEFLKGPVFTQLLLADEINRAPAKTQSALLEAMQERSVTVDGTTRPLPSRSSSSRRRTRSSRGHVPAARGAADRFLFKLDVGTRARPARRRSSPATWPGSTRARSIAWAFSR